MEGTIMKLRDQMPELDGATEWLNGQVIKRGVNW